MHAILNNFFIPEGFFSVSLFMEFRTKIINKRSDFAIAFITVNHGENMLCV